MTIDIPHYDAAIVGGGFGAVRSLYNLRKAGYKVHGFEKGSAIGGVWHHNRYPGARVDSDVPIYQLYLEDAWGGFKFSELFPGWKEIQAYFKYADEKLQISKDFTFNSTVTACHWNDSSNNWTVTAQSTDLGEIVCTATHIVFCTGFAAKKIIPRFKNQEGFKGQWFHTADWPWSGVDVKGKKVAIIGTGASGVQVIQEIASEVGSLTVFQRSINTAIPMRQRKLTPDSPENNMPMKESVEHFLSTKTGFLFDNIPHRYHDLTPAERKSWLDKIYAKGGLRFAAGNFLDALIDKEANRFCYDYWKDSVRARVKDPRKAELLAPTQPPYHILTKRPSLEQTFYEAFNQDNVDIVDLRNDSIVEFTETGIKTTAQEFDFDIVIFATGFDAVTGGFKLVDIRGQGGVRLEDKWKNGTFTHLGMTITKMPNFFFMYGPQGPCGFSNGPTSTTIQSDWAVRAIEYIEKNRRVYMVPTEEAENAWRKKVNDTASLTLLPLTKSWYMGSNVEDKPVESLNYVGGLGPYLMDIAGAEKDGYSRDFIFGA
ncbi:hypothetical protein BABINDRAFT_41602 [Babjeviella inositovora NRRL Y-12698]|uniref:FAD/NAD(P)-binding domain-containing protein n=1 Tax=Babjeviella inositovora NRRL Y-12698 TaxID=984486 RepID=A0A1E3QK86_9ASCO|nr:uncharacterized protein BABINDRAFT_41602 [Babjeviella inositovora NRRL Y-12698]ODQ77492.1 hypothetical protein BABINDRAFT_41602 [Babjeviella inositovora NRRL Y-12698]